MTVTDTTVALVFLSVSLVALVVQGTSLARIVKSGCPPTADGLLAYQGLLRTAVSRVVAAVFYVGLGWITVTAPAGVGVLPLAVFSLTQLMWLLNGLADVGLRRRISSTSRTGTGRHRRDGLDMT